MADAGNVDAACSDVGCHEDLDLAITERLQRSGALALRFVTMNRGRLNASAGKTTHNAVCAMLCAGKDQCTVNVFALQL